MRLRIPNRRHPAAAFAVLAVALSLTGFGYAAVDAATSKVSAQEYDQSAVAQGKSLFAEGCSSCHGLNAQGTDIAPSLIGVGAAAVDFQVSSGRMPMATQGVQAPRKQSIYDEEETAALAAWVASLAPGPAVPSLSQSNPSGADLALGGELFRTYCAQCHNFAAQGGALTSGKYAPSLIDATQTQIYEAMLTGPQNMPVFADTTISPDQKRAIIAYVEEVRGDKSPGGAALGKFGPVTEGLFAWVGGFALLLVAAVWIGVKSK